jgi:hypothetical protein
MRAAAYRGDALDRATRKAIRHKGILPAAVGDFGLPTCLPFSRMIRTRRGSRRFLPSIPRNPTSLILEGVTVLNKRGRMAPRIYYQSSRVAEVGGQYRFGKL